MPTKLSKHQLDASDGVLFTVTLSPCQLGAGLASEGSVEQAGCLTAFLDELQKQCSTRYNVEMQLAHVAANLSDEHRELLAMLGPTQD